MLKKKNVTKPTNLKNEVKQMFQGKFLANRIFSPQYFVFEKELLKISEKQQQQKTSSLA